MYMENGGADLLSEQPPRPEAPASPYSSSPYQDEVRAPIAPKRSMLIGGDDDEFMYTGTINALGNKLLC